MGANLIWQPTDPYIEGSHLQRLMNRHGLPDVAALQARGAADPAWFWEAVVQDLGIHWHKPYEQVLDTSRGIEWAQWFRGGKLNLATDCATKYAQGSAPEAPAILYESEEGTLRRWSYGELEAEASRVAGLLRTHGIRPGDRIGIFMPMLPEIAAVMLGAAKVGAIFTPIFSGYSAQAVASRLVDCGARLLFTADGFRRRGKSINMKQVADAACDLAPSVEKVVVIRRTGCEVAWRPERDLWYSEATAAQCSVAPALSLDPETPFMIIYTSGTTGKPKGAVHTHAGFAIKAAQDMAHCFDLRSGERIFWFTDIGWMMGPWLILGSLMLGNTCLLYDGAPDWPGPDRIWAMVDRHKLTHLGVSPTLIRALMPHGEAPLAKHDLSSLRILGSTGEL